MLVKVYPSTLHGDGIRYGHVSFSISWGPLKFATWPKTYNIWLTNIENLKLLICRFNFLVKNKNTTLNLSPKEKSLTISWRLPMASKEVQEICITIWQHCLLFSSLWLQYLYQRTFLGEICPAQKYYMFILETPSKPVLLTQLRMK